MISRKYTTAAVVSGMIAILAIAALASISFTTAAFAAQTHQKDTRCDKTNRGGGNPHDAQDPKNPHDHVNNDPSRERFVGNPHDACTGS